MLCGWLGLGPLLITVGTWAVSSRAKCCLISIKSPAMLGDVGDKFGKADTESTRSRKVSYIKIN
jgi:hypothetical protein